MTTATALNSDGPDSARVREVNSLIERISSDMEQVSELIDTSVMAREFQAMLPALVDLEKAMGSKTVIDHTVAHLAGLHHAGNLTGTSRVDLFLAQVFDLSRAEARARVDGAENTYGPARPAAAPDPTRDPEPGTDAGDGTDPGAGADGAGADSGTGSVPGDGSPGDGADPGADGAPGDGDDWSSEAPGGGPAGDAESERERLEREREEREREEREREERQRREQERLDREKAERRAAEERRRQAEADRREANRRAREKKLAAEKLRIINNELKNLLDEAEVGAEELRRQAIEEADNRSPEDLRDWIRNRVAEANLNSGDPLAAFKNRWLWMSEQQADGGVHLRGYLPAPTAALLKHLMAGAIPGFDRPKDDEADADVLDLGIPGLDPDGVAATRAKRNGPDRRRRAERYADLLHHVLSAYAAGKTEDTGNASIVLSLIADDADEIMQAGADIETNPAKARRAFMKRHPTNTGIDLSLFELMKIKAKPYDYLVLHDTAGNPLYAGRARRLGNFLQRVALFAAEGVCSYPGCTAPADFVELHHDWPHSDGGPTDINNLTFRCKEHHRDNNDKRDMQASRGWSARDPKTGRMGHTPPAASSDTSGVTINRTERAHFSAGERIRRKYEHLDSESGDHNAHPTDGSSAPAAGRDPDGTGVPGDPDETWMADYEDYLAEKYAEEAAEAGGPGTGAGAGHPTGDGFDEPEDTHYAAPLNFDDEGRAGEDWPGDEPTLFSA